MADEKLPEYVAGALAAFAHGESSDIPVAAINRFAREREAAALERAARVCDSGVLGNGKFTAENAISWARDTEAERLAAMIRALIHKEPANG